MKKYLLGLLFLTACSAPTKAPDVVLAPNEPAYCNPVNFKKLEVGKSDIAGIDRMHAFQLGQVTLVGLAVGQSDTYATAKMASAFGGPAEKKYCTWYFNDGNKSSTEAFNWFNLTNPLKENKDDISEHFYNEINGIFADNPINMLSCARDQKFVAMGCDGQRHRGPSVFAMLLAFSGCRPDHATHIANSIWGMNWVSFEKREAIATKAYELGNAKPAQRLELQRIFGAH